MSEVDYEAAYLETIKDPSIYRDDLIESASTILRACAMTLAVSRASLWLMSEDCTGMNCVALYDSEIGTFESGAVLSEELFPKYFDALYKGRVLDAVDAFTDPRTNELTDSYLQVLDVRSLLDATLRNVHNGELEGVLCTEMVGAKRDWTADEKMYVASMSDLLSQRLLTSELARTAQNYRALYESSSEGVMVFGEGVFRDVNPAGCRIFGASDANELIGLQPSALSPEFQPDGRHSAQTSAAFVEACLAGKPQTFEWVHLRLDGTPFDVEITLNTVRFSGEDTLFAHVRDITEKKDAERRALLARQELEHRASHDSLTGLLNREQLHQHVEEMIGIHGQSGHQVGLLLLDLNHFKEINDTLGHAAGDKVLVGLAELLKERVGLLNGTLFRLGGDEFVAVFDSQTCRKPFDDLTNEIHECLRASVEVDGVSFELGASIGAASFPDHGSDSHELLRCADVAMYHRKNTDGASPWYCPENDTNDRRRLSMVTELKQAMRDNELVLHFQPRINIKTGAVTGCEALVRWQHPELGLLGPCEFLPVAEMSELIHPLAQCVLEKAFLQINNLRELGYHVPVAVNLSARNLPDTSLFDLIETRLEEEGISPSLLEIEITESALIDNPQRSLINLQRLEHLGVSIAIDDFGTGYSSLSLLKQLPLDTLKIDRSFVNDMLTSSPDRVIVNSTVSLAHNFSAKVVAEGVENQKTLDALRALNCEEAQGFFIARPMPARALEEWIYNRTDQHWADQHWADQQRAA